MVAKFVRLVAISFFLIFVVTLSVAAQPEGYVEVRQLRTFSDTRWTCLRATDGVYDEAKFRALAADKNCVSGNSDIRVDFENESLLHYSAASDCHMWVLTKVLRSDALRKYKLIVNNIYGGCRAGGWRRGWIVIDRMPAGFVLEMAEVKVDRIHRGGADTFEYPKPPSIISREPIEAKEVDVEGCLPLTGQSERIISSAEALDNAIRGRDDVVRCREVMRSLKIDLEKHTLVGYSFSSGYCSRPDGLTFNSFKETSSDRNENRFLLRISYNKPLNGNCQVWKTYPVWVIEPLLPVGYGFGFEVLSK